MDGAGKAQIMAEAVRKAWTYEAIVAEGLDPRFYEIVDGELVELRPKSMEGARIYVRMTHFLHEHVERQGLGAVYCADRYLLRRDPRRERRPDLTFIARARIPAEDPDLFEGAPDLIVEVLSPSDPSGATFQRGRRDLEDGAREVWVVDPKFQTITVLSPGRPPRPHGVGDVLESPDVLPGFSLPLERLFAPIGEKRPSGP